MPRRTQHYIKADWTGGLNTAIDPGMLNDSDLVQADNVIFTTTGARVKREGLSYVGTAMPAVTHRSISSNVVTLVFASSVNIVSPVDQILHVGEDITVTTSNAGAEGDYIVTAAPILSISTTTVTNDTITYAQTAGDEGSTATSTLTVKRAHSYIDLTDFWRFDANQVKAQLLMAVSTQGNIYEYDQSERRDWIRAQREVFRIVCPVKSAFSADGGKYMTFADGADTTSFYGWIDYTGADSDPTPGGTGSQWDVSGATSEADVALVIKTAIDALAGTPFTTALETTNVTDDTIVVTSVLYEDATDAANVDIAATGFSVSVDQNGATVVSADIEKCSTHVMNGRYIVAFPAIGDKPIKYRPEDSGSYRLLGNTATGAPDFSILTEYLGKLFTDDKTDPDFLHYSATGSIDDWLGQLDSGGFPISPGDGDSVGINGLVPFKGRLMIGKQGRLFQMTGYSDYDFSVQPITDGLGMESHGAIVPVDQDDVVFLSTKGFHSLVATDQYGDFSSTFVSTKIQPTFNDWNQGRLENIQGRYIPSLNSIAYSVAERGETAQSQVYLYNIIQKEWYRWPNISCQSVSSRIVSNVDKLIFGTNDGRIIQAQNGSYSDFGTTGISYRVKTGAIYPGNDPQSIKGFKKLSFLYKPRGNFEFTVYVKIDNHADQVFTFSQETTGALLGVDFILGVSTLGVDNVLAPFTQSMDGQGRGITLTVTQSGTDEQVELYGFVLEYESEDTRQETV